MRLKKKDFISMLDVRDRLNQLLENAQKIKKEPQLYTESLNGKTLAMIFEKPSTRTRVSFEVAMLELGGHTIYLSSKELQLGRGETIADTARVLSRYVDGIMYRAFEHEKMLELARHSTVPVINGLDDLEHPCQIMADLLTIKEKKGFAHRKLAYVGDGNNVCNSLLLGAALTNLNMVAACPSNYMPNKAIVANAKKIARSHRTILDIIENPVEAVKNADIIYTDVWVSMGDEAETEEREHIFRPYAVNKALLSHAKKDCIVMHCLPAHRGYEITDDVIDGKHSVVWDQAENRLHVQKAILIDLLGVKK